MREFHYEEYTRGGSRHSDYELLEQRPLVEVVPGRGDAGKSPRRGGHLALGGGVAACHTRMGARRRRSLVQVQGDNLREVYNEIVHDLCAGLGLV